MSITFETVLNLIGILISGSVTTVIVTGIINMKKNKAETTSTLVSAAVEAQKICMENFTTISAEFNHLKNSFTELEKKFRLLKEYIDVTDDLLRRNGISIPEKPDFLK